MAITDRVLSFLKERRENILNGNINCIPLPFNRFKNEFPGIEQGKYFLVSGGSKAAKTQLTNFLFVYNTIFYAFQHRDKVHPKIFYYPLEETPETITLRFMAYLLYNFSKGAIRISPTDLKSTDENKVLSKEVLDLFETKEYKDIMQFYEECIEFRNSRNPTGVWKDLKGYAENHGTTYYKDIKITDELGQEKEVKQFDYYTPNDKNEYVFIIIDHVSLIESERGMDLRNSINKISEYLVIFRNRYNYIPVVVQQQNVETLGLEAFKSNKIRPTLVGLADSKATGKDCNMLIGITNPYSHELSEYLGYNILEFKSNIRFIEIVLNRDGNSNGICPLFFDGAVNDFRELPLPTDTQKLQEIYNYLNKIRGAARNTASRIFLLFSNIKKLFK